MAKPVMIPLRYERPSESEMREQSRRFLEKMRARRSIRHFSPDPVPLDVLETCIETAAQAPSGANKQPWTFALVTNPETKKRIREAAELEEEAFYGGRATEAWLRDLEPLGTTQDKEFLEVAPALIVVFAQRRGSELSHRHYYVSESVGIAVGMLLAALQEAGLATLTHTPSPMRFLGEILNRPSNESAYVLLPVGYPMADCEVPDIKRKPFSEVIVRT